MELSVLVIRKSELINPFHLNPLFRVNSFLIWTSFHFGVFDSRAFDQRQRRREGESGRDLKEK